MGAGSLRSASLAQVAREAVTHGHIARDRPVEVTGAGVAGEVPTQHRDGRRSEHGDHREGLPQSRRHERRPVAGP